MPPMLPTHPAARAQGRAAAVECTVEAGQALYLPAGWFHEVTSYATQESRIHLALNFWYHPPDNLKTAEAALQQPYRCAWRGRLRACGGMLGIWDSGTQVAARLLLPIQLAVMLHARPPCLQATLLAPGLGGAAGRV